MASTKIEYAKGGSDFRTKGTISCWVKRGSVGVQQDIWSWGENNSSDCYLRFDTADNVEMHCDGAGGTFNTTQLYRDVNGWYHFVFSLDGSNSTANLRRRFWINGVQIDEGSGKNDVSAFSNAVLGWHSTQDLWIGARARSQQSGDLEYFDGLISHFHYCSNYSYAASDFGSFDSTTGEWKINTAPNVQYGSEGFFLKMEDSSNMDLDSSGNNKTLTTSGTLTKTEDCPSNVFCTMNPLNHDYASTNTDIGAGNTFVYPRANDNYNYAVSTLGMPKGNGKFYAEVKYVTYDNVTAGVGIVDMEYVSEIFYQNRNLPEQTASTYIGRVIYLKNGYSIVPSTENNSYGSSYANGDIIQIACDMENGAIYFGKNGTWQNSGDPTSGASKTGAIDISSQSWYTGTTHWGFWCGDKASNHDRFAWNFGNGTFASQSGSFGSQSYSATAVSSAGTNASNNGVFEYNVPTGYTALSTKGLNK